MEKLKQVRNLINNINWQAFLCLGTENCIHCGSLLVKPSLLCEYCEKILFLQCSLQNLWENEIKAKKFLSLFSWEQDQNLILNKLIMNLKGSKQERAYKYYGKLIAARLRTILPIDDRLLICPCPSWSYQKDHAYYLAKALSDELGVSLGFPLLNGIKKAESKELSKSERLRNVGERFIINENFFEKFTKANETQILFVDDVITTGATLLAASEKLKDFKQIIGISLAFRR